MLQSENEKIIPHLISLGLDVHEDNTIGMDNGISYFKVGARFHMTPQFVHPLSSDKYTFEDAMRATGSGIRGRFNSEYSDVFVVTKRKIRHTRTSDAVLEARNTRTGEKHVLFNSYPEIESHSTYNLLLYI